MKTKQLYLGLFLILGLASCCDETSPSKNIELIIESKTAKDSLYWGGITKIYALGTDTTINRLPVGRGYKNGIWMYLPVSFSADSTVYVFERKGFSNEKLVLRYERNINYLEKCGILVTLRDGKKKSSTTFENYDLNIKYGQIIKRSFFAREGLPAISVKMIEK